MITATFTTALIALLDVPSPDLLAPKAGVFFYTVVVFGIVLLVLRKFAWPAIIDGLTAREKNIEDSLLKAERALEEARQLSADNERARKEAEVEAQKVIRDAREAADSLRAEEIEKTKSQLQVMQAQASADIEQQKKSALESLRSEVADLAINAAEKILGENMDADKNRRIVDTFLTGVNKN